MNAVLRHYFQILESQNIFFRYWKATFGKGHFNEENSGLLLVHQDALAVVHNKDNEGCQKVLPLGL